jgi:energy-converting hydrogenase Eha subunit C
MRPPRIDPLLRELIALSLLAVSGCCLALAEREFLFVAVFGSACAVTIIEAMARVLKKPRGRRG